MLKSSGDIRTEMKIYDILGNVVRALHEVIKYNYCSKINYIRTDSITFIS